MLKKKTLTRPTDKGFLDTKPSWQDDYVSGKKGQELGYFLK
jgi:hypothetical protein